MFWRVLRLASPIPPEQVTVSDSLFKVVSWALERRNFLISAQEHGELIQQLRVGRRILEESLPKPELATDHWHIAARLQPANHLGGDLFAYSVMPGYVRFLLADAVGHGLGSTLLAAECRSLWSALAHQPSLQSEAENLSQMLHETTGDTRFVAAHLGRCYNDGRVEYLACGQGPVFLLSQSGGMSTLERTDPPLGIFQDQSFTPPLLQMQSGDRLVVLTDGLLECEVEGKQFGVEGVCASLSGEPTREPVQLLADLFQAVNMFRNGASLRDDGCALVIQSTTGSCWGD
ncbi:serine/threonine-protein phosphatase [bacterium]|nr:serine/threonine-protein phosphatase [bacterium]